MPTTGTLIYLLTGVLPLILIAALLLALPVSALLLRLYRRAVIRGMAQGGGAPIAPEVAVRAAVYPPSSAAPLTLTYVREGSGRPAAEGGDLYRRARVRRWCAAGIYSAAGGVFAATLAIAFLLGGGLAIQASRFLVFFWVALWPLVLTLVLVATMTRRTKSLVPAAYIAGYALIALYVLPRSPSSSVLQLIALFLFDNLPPTLLFLVFLLRRVRAVAPLTAAFFLFATAGPVLVLTGLYLNPNLTRTLTAPVFALGVPATAVFVALIVLGLTVSVPIGWFGLQALRRAYRSKWVNDQSSIVDALWLFFSLDYGLDLAFYRPVWALAGPVAFGLYLATTRGGFHWLMRRRGRRGPTLLVLRVFRLSSRSEKLFEAITRHWRYAGPVQLLAGPDLAEMTVEPYQFLDFVTGRLGRQFVSDPGTLSRRLCEVDARPDFDGRYRVNDFFCREHTWQATLAALVQQVDAVFMDLRGFSSERRGSTYEIHQLLHHVPVARIVMLTDATTDHAFLAETAQRAWSRLPTGAPNRVLSDPRLTIIEAGRTTERSLAALLAAISRAAAGPDSPGRVSTQPAVSSWSG